MKNIIVFIILTILLSACSGPQPSIEEVQTAIAKTEQAQSCLDCQAVQKMVENPVQPTAFEPSATSMATPTSNEVSTMQSQSETPITADDRVIFDANPNNYILQAADLPLEGHYYAQEDTPFGPVTNNEIVISMVDKSGKQLGRKYLSETGRLSGWEATYTRGSNETYVPVTVYCLVTLYRSREGATHAVRDYTLDILHPEQKWTKVTRPMSLGDVNTIFQRSKLESDRDSHLWYTIEFAYRNYSVMVQGYGFKADVRHEFMEMVARIVLNHLENGPLYEPLTPTPTNVPKEAAKPTPTPLKTLESSLQPSPTATTKQIIIVTSTPKK